MLGHQVVTGTWHKKITLDGYNTWWWKWLQGYLLGNPSTDKRMDKNGVVQFLHGMAIISDELYEVILLI